jgi:hypothetical protein
LWLDHWILPVPAAEIFMHTEACVSVSDTEVLLIPDLAHDHGKGRTS